MRKHAKPIWPKGKNVQWNVCSFEMNHKKGLLIQLMKGTAFDSMLYLNSLLYLVVFSMFFSVLLAGLL